MPAYNPTMGGTPVMFAGGAMPSTAPGGATATLGTNPTPSATTGKGEPSIVAMLVIAAVGVIIAFHLAGMRAYFTVQAGR